MLGSGLMRDDCLYETPAVQEAIRRLPADVYDARQFRISRALYLSGRKEILPKDEWTKMEEVVYLYTYKNTYTPQTHISFTEPRKKATF